MMVISNSILLSDFSLKSGWKGASGGRQRDFSFSTNIHDAEQSGAGAEEEKSNLKFGFKEARVGTAFLWFCFLLARPRGNNMQERREGEKEVC
jgi:hypothetical protein